MALVVVPWALLWCIAVHFFPLQVLSPVHNRPVTGLRIDPYLWQSLLRTQTTKTQETTFLIKILLKQTGEMRVYWSAGWVMTSTEENFPIWYKSTEDDPGLQVQKMEEQDGGWPHKRLCSSEGWEEEAVLTIVATELLCSQCNCAITVSVTQQAQAHHVCSEGAF